MLWADYSGGRPSGAALKAAGFGGVIRYIGLGNEGKQVNAAEYRNLVSADVQVLLVGEAGTGDAWGTETDDDFARGQNYARICLADARANGIPDSVGIACAADAHAQTFQIDDVIRYAKGWESVVGKGRLGFYGFQETLTAVHNAGIGSWYWRCGSAPNAAERTWTHFWQRNSGERVRIVSGVTCDINDQLLPLGNINPAPAFEMKGIDTVDTIQVPASAEKTSVRIQKIPGGAGAKLIVRMPIGADGMAPDDGVVWQGEILAWGSGKSGVGGNPLADGRQDYPLDTHTEFPLPNALWCDYFYSSNVPFEIDVVG